MWFFVIFDIFVVSCQSTDIYLYFGGVRYFKYLLFSHDDINNISNMYFNRARPVGCVFFAHY